MATLQLKVDWKEHIAKKNRLKTETDQLVDRKKKSHLILRAMTNVPWYNHTLYTAFNIPYVRTSSMKESINITTKWKPIPIHYYNP